MVGALQEALANGKAGVIPELRAACRERFGEDWRASVPGEWEAKEEDEEEEAAEAVSPGRPTKEDMRAKQRERATMHEVRGRGVYEVRGRGVCEVRGRGVCARGYSRRRAQDRGYKMSARLS